MAADATISTGPEKLYPEIGWPAVVKRDRKYRRTPRGNYKVK